MIAAATKEIQSVPAVISDPKQTDESRRRLGRVIVELANTQGAAPGQRAAAAELAGGWHRRLAAVGGGAAMKLQPEPRRPASGPGSHPRCANCCARPPRSMTSRRTRTTDRPGNAELRPVHDGHGAPPAGASYGDLWASAALAFLDDAARIACVRLPCICPQFDATRPIGL